MVMMSQVTTAIITIFQMSMPRNGIIYHMQNTSNGADNFTKSLDFILFNVKITLHNDERKRLHVFASSD